MFFSHENRINIQINHDKKILISSLSSATFKIIKNKFICPRHFRLPTYSAMVHTSGARLRQQLSLACSGCIVPRVCHGKLLT